MKTFCSGGERVCDYHGKMIYGWVRYVLFFAERVEGHVT
jgi:hypothetical protein